MIAIFHILFCFFVAGSLAEQPRIPQALPSSRCSLRCSSRDLAKRKAERDLFTFLAYVDYCNVYGNDSIIVEVVKHPAGYLHSWSQLAGEVVQIDCPLNFHTMLPANKDARAINAFVDCPIPSPRDYFCRYGARAGGAGVLTTDERSEASISFSNTVIDSVVRGSQIFAETTEEK